MEQREATNLSVDVFRLTIASFINSRREAKQKSKEDDTAALEKYDYTTWLSDAAHRVGQIQAATHVAKATHPDARGSSLHVSPNDLPKHSEVGSHMLGDAFAQDVVGNAAALDVFKFLKVEVGGRRLLDWMQASDPALRLALHADPEIASSWMTAFSRLVRGNEHAVSHQMAKQLYWCLDDSPENNDAYHLLQPLSSSSLAHTIHTEINETRFGDANKDARAAFRNKQPFEKIYYDYRGLVVRKLGGTKPQNISQLNSERGGVNYLLASLPPPAWKRESLPKLSNKETAFGEFSYFENVPILVRQLADFLLTDPPKNAETRTKREAIEQALGQQLPLFAVFINARFEPGWTRSPDCELPHCEQLWLDEERIELPSREDHYEKDEAFKTAHTIGDWQDDVAKRFANWLNENLRKAGLIAVGNAEYKHWARQAIIDASWPGTIRRRAGVKQ